MQTLRTILFDSVYTWILDNDLTPYVLVDASGETVSVPREHVHDDRIILNIHPRSIDGLMASDEGLSFMARFDGRSRPIVVPADALMALYSRETNQGVVFQGDSIAIEMITEEPEAAPEKTPRRPQLTLVK